MSYLLIFQNSFWPTPQLQHDASSLPKALQAREGTENSFYACACTHRKTWSLLQESMQLTGCITQLLPANSEHKPTWDQPVWESQINNLIKTTSSSVFLLTFSILHVNSTGFCSWKDRAHIKNKLPNGTAPLLTIKKTQKQQQRWESRSVI